MGRDFSVQRHRPFGVDVGSAVADEGREGGDQSARGFGKQSEFDGDAGAAEPLDAAAVDMRSGVGRGHDDASDSRVNQRIGAGGSLTMMAAGFERDVHGRVGGNFRELLEGIDLGVGTAELLVAALGEHVEVAVNNDRPDGRIRLDVTASRGGQLESPTHDRFRIRE